MVNCTTHPDRNATRKCYECGKSICRLCLTQEVVGSRITSYSSIDTVTQVDYGFFCPSCFVRYGKEKHYHKGTKGAITRFKARNKYPVTFFWILFIVGIVVNLFSYPNGFYLWIGSGFCLIGAEVIAIMNFKKFKRAFKLAEAAPIYGTISAQKEQPTQIRQSTVTQSQTTVSEASDTFFCPKCGVKVEQGSDFCRKCGRKL